MPTPTLMPVIIANNSSASSASLGASLRMLCSIVLLIPFLLVFDRFIDKAYKTYDFKKADRICLMFGLSYIILILALIPFFAGIEESIKESSVGEKRITGTRDGVEYVCEKDKWQNTYCTPIKKEGAE